MLADAVLVDIDIPLWQLYLGFYTFSRRSSYTAPLKQISIVLHVWIYVGVIEKKMFEC